MPIQRGEGIGLTPRRSLYLRANRDLVRALRELGVLQSSRSVFTPGVPASTSTRRQSRPARPRSSCLAAIAIRWPSCFTTAASTATASFSGRHHLLRRRRARHPARCLRPEKTQRDPTQILWPSMKRQRRARLLAKRWCSPASSSATSVDGLPSVMEPGYDPVKNPDPAGDDYHPENPGGTEGNFRYDRGEPYTDSGLDGARRRLRDRHRHPRLLLTTARATAVRPIARPGGWLQHDPHT